jgi:hypothetical protein
LARLAAGHGRRHPSLHSGQADADAAGHEPGFGVFSAAGGNFEHFQCRGGTGHPGVRGIADETITGATAGGVRVACKSVSHGKCVVKCMH